MVYISLFFVCSILLIFFWKKVTSQQFVLCNVYTFKILDTTQLSSQLCFIGEDLEDQEGSEDNYHSAQKTSES